MTILSYLLLGFIVCLAVGSWVLWNALHRAADGYEDGLGFHLGAMLPLRIATPAPVSDFPTVTGIATSNIPMSASVANLQTTTAPVSTSLKSPDATPSPLYRRHRRSSNSRPPIPVASASPFELKCAATRQRANEVDSTPPLNVSISSILGQKTPSPKA